MAKRGNFCHARSVSLSPDRIVEAAIEAADLGIPAVAIFPEIEKTKKDPDGSEALNPENIVIQAIKAVKAAVPT